MRHIERRRGRDWASKPFKFTGLPDGARLTGPPPWRRERAWGL